MTTGTRTHAWDGSTQAGLYAYISNTISLVSAVGLTIVPGSDTTPGSAGATTTGSGVQGSVTFQFPDSLQSTMPIYLRLQFSTDSVPRPFVAWSVGSGLNGSYAPVQPLVNGNTGQTSPVGPLTSYACYTDGTFALVLGYGVVNGGVTNNSLLSLVVDRDRNTAGVAQGSGYLVEGTVSSTGTQTCSRSLYGPASADVNYNFQPVLFPSISATSSAEGANVNVFRHYSMTPGVKPHVGMLSYFSSEFGALTPFTATVLGGSHTYMPMGSAMNYWSANPIVTHCCAIRWE